MAHFADLETATQIAIGPHVRAVGWLSAEHSYPKGLVSESFIARLRTLCAAWSDSIRGSHWPVAAGPYTCELCKQIRASGNLGIPADGVLFVVPEMVAHIDSPVAPGIDPPWPDPFEHATAAHPSASASARTPTARLTMVTSAASSGTPYRDRQ
jgi:hypothetical protein